MGTSAQEVSKIATGYLHPEYAKSLAEFGRPRQLPLCGGWVLERTISASPHSDAAGCYPLFACQDWSQLRHDLDNLGNELVTVSLVADPFAPLNVSDLRQCFDVVLPFKERFVVDLRTPLDEIGSEHHRYYAQQSLKKVRVELCPNPTEYLEEWVALYQNIIHRHNLTGIRAFSRTAFVKQLAIPGMVMFRAACRDETVGLDLWYVQGDVAYGHLVAYSPLGYRSRASYALKWHLINYFADKVRWIDLGGGAGVGTGGKTGLSQHKEGWATGTRPTYFCGRVLDQERYSQLVTARHMPSTDFFPAYRVGEFE